MAFMRSSAGDLVYRLTADETVDDVSYAMMRSNSLERLLPVALVREDGEREFRYATEGMRVASSYVASRVFSAQQFATFLMHVIDAFEEAHAYMMPSSGLAASMELIYVGANLDVRMVYVPVQGIMANYGLQQCLGMVAEALEVDRGEASTSYLNTVIAELQSPNFSASRLRRMLATASGNGVQPHAGGSPSPNRGRGEGAGRGAVPAPVTRPGEVVAPPAETSGPDPAANEPEGKRGLLNGLFGSKKDTAENEDGGKKKGGFSLFPKKESRSAAVDVPFQIPGQEPILVPPAHADDVHRQASGDSPAANPVARASQDDNRAGAEGFYPGMRYESEGFGETVVVGADQVKMKADGPESVDKTPVAVPAFVTRVSTGERKRIDLVPFRIGRRNRMVDFYVPSEAGVSRVHAIIGFDGERFTIEDNASSNHTFLNGHMLSPHVPFYLNHGDTIRLGSIEFVFSLG